MTPRRVPFKQVDVFTAVPFRGNPLAVFFEADDLSSDDMQAIARWTNLSETTFVCQPTDPAADYLVRIFTPEHELPFAGHPTIGTAHAFIEQGHTPRQAGRLVQQCGIGLVQIEERSEGIRAFAAPPTRIEPLPDTEYGALTQALGTDEIDFAHVPPSALYNGVGWLAVGVASADLCVRLKPDRVGLSRIVQRAGMNGIALHAPHAAGGPADREVRCIVVSGNLAVYEDPVTGSANAALAELFGRCGHRPGPRYTVRQGTAAGYDGRVSVEYDDARGITWIGGPALTLVDGNALLP